MNLKEAKKLGKLDQFIQEHEIGKERFAALLELMTRGTPASAGTTDAEPSAD
jgi:hypothetical protein